MAHPHRTSGLRALTTLFFFWAAILVVVGQQQGSQPLPQLIIDTDMSTDVDDVIAVCLANQLHNQRKLNLLAVVHNTGLEIGVGAVSVINHFYGNDDIAVGAYVGTFDNPNNSPSWVSGPYVPGVVSAFPSPIRNSSECKSAVAVYRSTLAAAADNSVRISSIGFFTNIAALLQSGPDDHSPLSGKELVARKVEYMAVMGGRYPNSSAMGHEWNFGGGCRDAPICPTTPKATSTVISMWPPSVPMLFSGWELGNQVKTGARLTLTNGSCASTAQGQPPNPCAAAFKLYGDMDPRVLTEGRSSWDPSTTLVAATSNPFTGAIASYYDLHNSGSNTVNTTSGANAWVATPAPGGVQGSQAYLILKNNLSAGLIASAIDTLLCETAHGKNQ
eukprot:m.84819 g.84819  ORF g.84819 m.84819 type:complete len:388 (-) comp25807_c0_seq1:144-1307(-)